MTCREWFHGFDDGSYHESSLTYKWHRLMHYLFGPLRGCSCSGPSIPGAKPSLLAAKDGSCFHSPWRISYPARDGYRDRLRVAELERRVRELEAAERKRERHESAVRDLMDRQSFAAQRNARRRAALRRESGKR